MRTSIIRTCPFRGVLGCLATFDSPVEREQHLPECHGHWVIQNIDLITENTEPDPYAKEWGVTCLAKKCSICGIAFPPREMPMFDLHNTRVHNVETGVELPCPVARLTRCEEVFETTTDVTHHIDAVHASDLYLYGHDTDIAAVIDVCDDCQHGYLRGGEHICVPDGLESCCPISGCKTPVLIGQKFTSHVRSIHGIPITAQKKGLTLRLHRELEHMTQRPPPSMAPSFTIVVQRFSQQQSQNNLRLQSALPD